MFEAKPPIRLRFDATEEMRGYNNSVLGQFSKPTQQASTDAQTGKSLTESVMGVFQPPRDRDAYASIRGYVYQIDRTVDRWLDLATGQVLELERGEDIDLVGRMIAGDGACLENRLLEQIKHRETRVTLRAAAALEAIANFHDHRLNNPGVELRFCFLTNAIVGCEQLNPFPDGVPGITLWEQVRTHQLRDSESLATVEHLRRFLANLPRPDGFAEAVWVGWQGYLATVGLEEFKEFIERFEWSTGQPDAERLLVALRARVIALGFARDESEADALADRLFVFVTRLLTRAGPKRLTVEERARLLTAPTLLEADRALLAHLRFIVAEHSDQLDRLQSDVSALGNRVETLFLSRAAERVELTFPVPDLSRPRPVARLAFRQQTAKRLCRVLASSGWLALHGGPDIGKSQLALQIVDAHGGCRGWVRFHHAQPTAEAARHLEAALAALAAWNQIPRRSEWYAEALTAVGAGSLVVLDDLPRIPGDDPFAEHLVRFGQTAREVGVRVASTSQFELPTRLRRQLGDWLNDQLAPPFTDEEAAELFRAHGALDSFLLEQRLRFLNRQAAGHSLLLTATAEFLAARAWRYREEEIDALLRGDHTQAILPELVDRLTRTLGDSPRELLYRLTLPLGLFDSDDLMALASVAPLVERPRERLNELLGAWVQRDTDTWFAVSPLVRPLGRSELAVDVRAQCFRGLAEVITRRRVMNPLDGEQAIFYNMEAGDPGRATTIYVLFLVEALKAGQAEHVIPVIDKWREISLPTELSVGNRLFVRAYQLTAFTKYELDTRFVVSDIDNLLEQATDRDGWGIVALAGQSLSRFRTRDPARVLQYVRRAVELPTVFGSDGREIVFDRVSLPDMLWMLVTDLRTSELLGQWFDAVEAIPEGHRARFWESEVGRQAVWLVPNKVYATEWEKPNPEQDWNSLLQRLGNLLSRVQSLRQPRLEAAMTAVMLEILADRKRLAEAPALAEAVLSRWPVDPDVQFKVRGTWGRLFAYQNCPDTALPLLDTALSQPHNGNDHERVRCLLAASICVGPQDLRYAEQARDLARASSQAPAIEAARALGEYALSVFQVQGGQAGACAAFAAWSEAMGRFFGVPRKDKFWRDLFPLFAHATSYLTLMAREGRPPERTSDGGAFIAPARGFLMKEYTPQREGLEASVAFVMGSYGAAAGAGEEAARWMRLAVEESRRVGAWFILVASGAEAIAEMLACDRFEDAVEMGVFVGRGKVVRLAIASRASGNFEGTGVDLSAEFRILPENQRRLGDCFALISGVLPAAITLVRLSLSNSAAAVSAGQRLAASLSGSRHGRMRRAGTVADGCRVLRTEQRRAYKRAPDCCLYPANRRGTRGNGCPPGSRLRAGDLARKP